jgi:hypothetical protein
LSEGKRREDALREDTIHECVIREGTMRECVIRGDDSMDIL